MTGPCCVGGRVSRRPARRLSSAAASIVSGALLLSLPKCPLCLAGWLTVLTGAGFSAAGVAWVRGMLVVVWVAALAIAARTDRIFMAENFQNKGRALPTYEPAPQTVHPAGIPFIGQTEFATSSEP